jgi:hypothetical protein
VFRGGAISVPTLRTARDFAYHYDDITIIVVISMRRGGGQ